MSCPSWRELAAWRDDPQAGEPAEWREALEHLDRGCPLCRHAALAADPTLVFRRLVAPRALQDRSVYEPAPAQETSDVESMRRAVAAMRAARRVEAAGRRSRSAWMSWKRWGVAAALALAALSLPAGPSIRRDSSAPGPMAARRLPARIPARMSGAVPAVLFAESAATALAGQAGEDLPTLEGVDNRPGARVYHMGGDELTVTMIFDETLDV